MEYAFGLGKSSTTDANEKTTYSKVFKVVPDTCMEICLAQFWSSLHDTDVDVEIKFSGVFINVSNKTNGASLGGGGGEFSLLDTGNSGFSRLDISSTIRKQEVAPAVQLG